MSSPLYQFVINLAVSLPIQRSQRVLVEVSVWELGAIDKSCLCRVEIC